MTKKEILEKVEKKREKKKFIEVCLDNETCPECGDDLESEEIWLKDYWPCRPHKKYRCKCGFKYKKVI